MSSCVFQSCDDLDTLPSNCVPHWRGQLVQLDTCPAVTPRTGTQTATQCGFSGTSAGANRTQNQTAGKQCLIMSVTRSQSSESSMCSMVTASVWIYNRKKKWIQLGERSLLSLKRLPRTDAVRVQLYRMANSPNVVHTAIDVSSLFCWNTSSFPSENMK